ncbi:MAG: precorrin-6y C5,15-methyltransferase (decarboxylating) subunit CbiE [Magnetococcales bacterium]|nr:precorrin-6y C5,15-methyltransferase (decarboxylating) subunit CbiE [Magnetococcales bacterium]
MTHPISILGVLDSGPDDLSMTARKRLSEAELVLAEDRFLHLYGPVMAVDAEKRSYSRRLNELPHWLRQAMEEQRRVVVLATGDPLFHGLAAYLADKLPSGSLDVLHQVSTLQVAFARLTLPWSHARLVSLHRADGGDWDDEADFAHPLYPLWRALDDGNLVGVLTSPENTPQRIARMLVRLGWEEHWHMHVGQRLGRADERVDRDIPPQVGVEREFLHPNVVILERRRPARDGRLPTLGWPDEFYQKKVFAKGLITRREVRAMVLAHLTITDGDILWDIGAGSGSVGLEAAGLTPNGQVWAMEKNEESVHHIRDNRQRMRRYNYRIDHGTAPEGLEHWPDPDGIFIGGSGGGLEALLALSLARLKPNGRLVVNLVALENLTRTLQWLDQHRFPWGLIQTGGSVSQPLASMHRLEPQAPVWIITVNKESPSP